MNINQMRNFIILLKNEGQGAFNTPEESDIALNAASMDKFNEEKRQFESTGYISNNLSNFKKSVTINFSAGSSPKPADYDYATNADTINTTGKVDIVPESEWAIRINDPIDVPDSENILIAIRDQIYVYPTATSQITLYYLRVPVIMVFGYTIVDDQIVYNSGTSTSCDWPISCHDDIVLRACAYLGVPLSDELLMKLKAYKKQTENV